MMKENNCHIVKNNLNEYLDGELNEHQKTEFTRHLAECSYCRVVLSDYQFIDTALKETTQVEVPLELKFKVLEAIKRKKLKRLWFLNEKIRVAVFLTAALLITIGLRYALPTWYGSMPESAKPSGIQERTLSDSLLAISPTILEVANLKSTSQELEKLMIISSVVIESREIREKEVLYNIIVSEKEMDNFIEELTLFKEKVELFETFKATNSNLESGTIYIYIREEKK